MFYSFSELFMVRQSAPGLPNQPNNLFAWSTKNYEKIEHQNLVILNTSAQKSYFCVHLCFLYSHAES